MPKIVLEHVTKRFDKFVAVEDLNMVIEDRDFVTLLGPSGCGKTTTLRMIAGLETPTEGRITIGDTVVFDAEKGINIAPGKRDIGFLFQNYALWPHMTVYQNISFGLENLRLEQPKIAFEARVANQMLGILDDWKNIVEMTEESREEKGKINTDKLYLSIIDKYTVSMFTAKKIAGYKLHEAEDPQSVVDAAKEELNAAIAAANEKAAQDGMTLNDKFEYVKDGEVVKSVRRLCKEEMDLEVRRVSRILKIGIFMHRYPAELSGGQQQRVAIARTLATSPKVLFMDEPLSNLDAKLRLEMRTELKRLHAETDSTFVYVTHDQLEAMTLATKVCLMSMGLLQQYDPPLVTYNKPNNLFVADFVGNPAMNFIAGKATISGNKAEVEALGRKFVFETSALDISKAAENADGAEEKAVEDDGRRNVVVGVRPEFVRVGQGSLSGTIYATLPAGMETTVKLDVDGQIVTSVVFGSVDYPFGQEMKYEIVGENILLFDKVSQNMLGIGSLTLADDTAKPTAKKTAKTSK
ncbi:MAG: ABC transporter ATP-binding protein [Corallococcus sp.]|nr:ABC transporter ATP-binding protein [Corallococcus sp.]